MTQHPENKTCPACGEAVRETWKICPVCEAALGEFRCPGCRLAVKANWRRCPECGTRLICPACGIRLSTDQTDCPRCRSEALAADDEFIDPVTGMAFVRVPGGTFNMGDTLGEGIGNEQPVHEVSLDDFYMGRFAVTQAQWQCLMAGNPSRFVGQDRPVEQVSWHDAQAYIETLIQRNNGRYRFSLPTEAQWEYAARSGGRNEPYAGGNPVDTLAWYQANSDGATRPVGQLSPNALGLYDMSGNVWEWCADTFHAEAYKRHGRHNPAWLADGEDRVIRGGSWNLDAWSARCARRFSYRTDCAGPALGFRLVRLD